ncbi:MAG: S8 family serine peptidase [Proteobacteria bacterium]|nr:S8 family serine peptidase [Pseudomonadota bacterium]
MGMCPYCKILVVKVVEIDKSAGKDAFAIKDSSIIAGLAYVSGFKVGGQPLVRVINASFGKFEKSRSVELFLKALKSYGRGTLTVAAAGNEDTMKRQYPAGFDAVLSVSNVLSDTEHPTKSVSSNFGVWVDIAAPGDGSCAGFGGGGILSSVPGAGNGCKVGTSMASPVVAGIAGLVLAKEPDLTADQLEQRLRDTAVPDYLYADATNNGYRPNIQGVGLVPLLGSGVVNASIALDPTQDRAPPVTSQNLERVRSGCGLISGSSKGNDGFAWLLLIAPLLLLGRRLKKLKV